jgi:hypothetical protein
MSFKGRIRRTINDVRDECKHLFFGEERSNTHWEFYPQWVFYFWKKLLKSCVQVVTTRIHVHSLSFITYQNH